MSLFCFVDVKKSRPVEDFIRVFVVVVFVFEPKLLAFICCRARSQVLQRVSVLQLLLDI